VKQLIVTSDDFGAALEVNVAVERAHRDGILSAASLMVGAPALDDAVARARANLRLRVGLHLVLVEGRPVLPLVQVPDLVDSTGHFRTDMARAGAAMFFLPGVKRQLRAEIEAQFAAFAATGLAFDHVNSHKHFHLHPTIASMMVETAAQYGVKGARVPLEPQAVLGKIEPHKASGVVAVTSPFARALRSRFARAGIVSPDAVFGLAWSGAMTPARVAGLIKHLPDGLSEIYVHPATGPYPGCAPGYQYEAELAALTDPAALAALSAQDIRLGGFADFCYKENKGLAASAPAGN
jgi:hopanoid biosynthesis associated protein HpnK